MGGIGECPPVGQKWYKSAKCGKAFSFEKVYDVPLVRLIA